MFNLAIFFPHVNKEIPEGVEIKDFYGLDIQSTGFTNPIVYGELANCKYPSTFNKL